MRRVLVPLLALLLAAGAPASARADEPDPEPAPLPTTTVLTASTVARDSNDVTLAVTVSAEDAVPEGEVQLADGATTLATVPLASGTASWSGTLATGWHDVTASYVPLDERWDTSTSASLRLFVGNHCAIAIDACSPHQLRFLAPATVRAGKPFKVRLDTRGRGTRTSGTATLTVYGARDFTWSREVRMKRGHGTIRGPRLHRPGRYKLRLLYEPDDGGAAQVGTRMLRVKSPKRV